MITLTLLSLICITLTSESKRIPIYQYYAPVYVDHFYTSSWSELGTGDGTWSYGGIGFYLSESDSDGGIPLHRYYWNYNGRKDHLYTTTPTETSDSYYVDEGIIGYCYQSNDTADMVPLYRYYDSINIDHLYTTNYSGLVFNDVYNLEFTICYVFASPEPTVATTNPTKALVPSKDPTKGPTTNPTNIPTGDPTFVPAKDPTKGPTTAPIETTDEPSNMHSSSTTKTMETYTLWSTTRDNTFDFLIAILITGVSVLICVIVLVLIYIIHYLRAEKRKQIQQIFDRIYSKENKGVIQEPDSDKFGQTTKGNIKNDEITKGYDVENEDGECVDDSNMDEMVTSEGETMNGMVLNDEFIIQGDDETNQ